MKSSELTRQDLYAFRHVAHDAVARPFILALRTELESRKDRLMRVRGSDVVFNQGYATALSEVLSVLDSAPTLID